MRNVVRRWGLLAALVVTAASALTAANGGAASAKPLGPRPQITSYPTGRAPYMSGRMALDLPHHLVYALPDGHGVDVLDTASKKVSLIKTGAVGTAIATDHATHRIYVANSASSSKPGTVSVIKDTKVVATVTLAVKAYPAALLVDSTDGDVYVADSGTGTVAVISGTHLVKTITVGSDPVALAQVNGQLVVANSGSNNVSIIKHEAVVATPTVGTTPVALAFDPTQDELYVADEGSDEVSVIDMEFDTVGTPYELPAGSRPSSLALQAPAPYPTANASIVVGLAGTHGGGGGVSNTGIAVLFNGQVNGIDMVDTVNESVVGVTADLTTSYVLVEMSQDNQPDPALSFLYRNSSTSVPLGRADCCGGAGAVAAPGAGVIWTANKEQIVKLTLPAPPTVTITRPAANAVYHKGQRVTTSFRCRAPTNDVAQCVTASGPRIHSGARLDTSKLGAFVFAVRGRASDGQETTKSVKYFVVPKHAQ